MKEVIKHKIKIKELIEFIIGCFLVALAFNLFMSPNNLVAGGISGLSLVLKPFYDYFYIKCLFNNIIISIIR